MDLRDSKTQKIIIGALAFFIVVYFWYSRVYSRYDNEITLKNREFETVTTNLRNVELKAKSLDALKVEYADLLERYNEVEELLPEVKQIPSILVQLHTASSLTGTKITKVEPLPISSRDFYNESSFRIQLEGTYHDFGTFISYVANFPFIANISDMDIEAVNVTISRSNDTESEQEIVGKKQNTMNATFVLSTYFVKEEERLKELTL
jgi:type IV pilus assembly protein PilO